MKKPPASTYIADWRELEEKQEFSLKLFITGASPNSARAIANLKNICEKYINGAYQLEIIDVYQQPATAKIEQIVALPMLMKCLPLPVKRLFGDMSDTEKVIRGLGINN